MPLALGGPDTHENCKGICRGHHLLKTLLDVKAIAKIKRLIAREDGTRRPRKPIPSPGFKPAGGKGFRWGKRKFPKRKPRRELLNAGNC